MPKGKIPWQKPIATLLGNSDGSVKKTQSTRMKFQNDVRVIQFDNPASFEVARGESGRDEDRGPPTPGVARVPQDQKK